jgi:hypothetical protein
MLITKDILQDFLNDNNAEFGLITNYSGEVIVSLNINHEDSIQL